LEVVGYAVFVAAAVSGCLALGSLADKALNSSGNIASLSAFKHSFEEWYEGEISTGTQLDLAEGCLTISQIVLAHADKVLLNGAIGQSLLPGLGMAISLAKLAHACHEHKVAHEKFQSTAAEYRDVHARYDEAQTIGQIIDEDSEKLAELMGLLIPLQASKKAIYDTIE
jgi:hypothetical protein